ncbi:MAG: hypothetical protein WAZ77_01645 [Candidatus Nitrosopolaris sp.]
MPLMAPSSPEPPAVAIAAAYYRSHREVRFFDDQKLRFVSVPSNALGIAEFGKIETDHYCASQPLVTMYILWNCKFKCHRNK